MWSGAWNKRKLTSEIFNRFLPSTVSRALDCWSGGHGFKPYWGQFLTNLQIGQIIWQKCVRFPYRENPIAEGQKTWNPFSGIMFYKAITPGSVTAHSSRKGAQEKRCKRVWPCKFWIFRFTSTNLCQLCKNTMVYRLLVSRFVVATNSTKENNLDWQISEKSKTTHGEMLTFSFVNLWVFFCSKSFRYQISH